MSPRARAALELVALAAMAVVALGLGSSPQAKLATGFALSGSVFRRWLVLRGRAPAVPWGLGLLELASLLLLLVDPIVACAPVAAGLVGVVLAVPVFGLARAESLEASRLDDLGTLAVAGASLALALWPVARGYEGSPSLALALGAALAVEMLSTGGARTAARAEERTSTFGLVGATAALHGAPGTRASEGVLLGLVALAVVYALAREVRARAPGSSARFVAASMLAGSEALFHARVDLETVVLFAFAAALALGRRPLARGSLLLVIAIVLLRPASQPLEVVERAGPWLGWIAAAGLAAGTLFLVARVLSPQGTPSRKVQLAALGLAGLVAVEAGLRVVQRWSIHVVLRDAVPLLGATSAAALDPGTETRTDFRGFRFSARKPDATTRIVLLGGSSAYGFPLPDRATSLPGRLEARLLERAPGARAHVICLAHEGYTSDQELAIVLADALDLGADVFLAIDGYNDVSYLAGKDAYPGDIFSWPQHRRGLAHPLGRFWNDRSLILHDLLAPILIETPWRLNAATRLAPGTGNAFYLDGLVSNEVSIAALARDRGVRFAWAFAPLADDRPVPAPNERVIPPDPLRIEGHRRALEARARVPGAIASQGGVALDLAARVARRSSLAPTEEWFLDVCHYTEAGSDAIADELAAALVETGVVSR